MEVHMNVHLVRRSLLFVGLAALLSMLVAAVDADNQYVLEPGELHWNDLQDGGLLPVQPDEPFAIVLDVSWVPCVDPETLDPVPEAERADPWPYPYELSLDTVLMAREDLLIPCTVAVVLDPQMQESSTQAVMRWRFRDGLAEGTYVLELFDGSPEGRNDQTWQRKTVVVGSEQTDGANGADGEEPVVVPRPERVETGAGGTADGGLFASLLLLLGTGVMIGRVTYPRRTG
jgi:hypothetical protein